MWFRLIHSQLAIWKTTPPAWRLGVTESRHSHHRDRIASRDIGIGGPEAHPARPRYGRSRGGRVYGYSDLPWLRYARRSRRSRGARRVVLCPKAPDHLALRRARLKMLRDAKGAVEDHEDLPRLATNSPRSLGGQCPVRQGRSPASRPRCSSLYKAPAGPFGYS